MAKQELLATIRDRYRASSKKDKGRILDEFIAVTGHHRKHGIRLLGQSGDDGEQQPAAKKGRRIYDEAVRQAVIVVWEAAEPDLRQAAEGGVAPSGGVHGAPWPPGSGPWGAPTAAGGQRRHPGPAAPADQDTGEPPAPTQEAAVARPQYSGTNLRRLECARHRDSWRLTWWSTTAAPCGVP